VDPEGGNANEGKTPGTPYVEGGVNFIDVSSAFTIFPTHQELSGQDGCSQPTEAAFDRLVFTLRSIPGLDIKVSFTMGNSSKSEPEEESSNGEEVLGRDEKSVNQKETSKEVNQ
jgi:hypothetical protein